jgi:hypothetical protein
VPPDTSLGPQLDTTDPVPFPPREPVVRAFAVKVRRAVVEQRRFDIVECIDADHRVAPSGNVAGHDRHDAAASADMEDGRACAECVFTHFARIGSSDAESRRRMGRPHTAVFDAEAAAAYACGNAVCVRPLELEAHIVAVTAAANQHVTYKPESPTRNVSGMKLVLPRKMVPTPFQGIGTRPIAQGYQGVTSPCPV